MLELCWNYHLNLYDCTSCIYWIPPLKLVCNAAISRLSPIQDFGTLITYGVLMISSH